MPRIWGFIPARFGSTRFRAKPLAKIMGKPMIQHVYESAGAAKVLEKVFVATDSHEIARVVEEFGGKAIITREDHISGTDRVCEAANIVGLEAADVVVNIQGDQPLFSPLIIERLVSPFLNGVDIPMSTVMYPIPLDAKAQDPNLVKVVTDNFGYALYFSRSLIPFPRILPEQHKVMKHLGFYAYKKSFLDKFHSLPEGKLEAIEKLEQLRALENGYRILVLESPSDSIEVDVPSDIEKIEALLEKKVWK